MDNERLDLSGFVIEPSSDPAEPAEPVEMRLIDEIGTTRWDFGAPYKPEKKNEEIDQLAMFSSEVREQARLSADGNTSVAIVDWTSLQSTCRLLGADEVQHLDPFVALADLSAVIAAVVFYDCVLVLDRGETTHETETLVGLNSVIRPIAPTSATLHSNRMELLLNAQFAGAITELERATHAREGWLDELRAMWERLIPGASFPQHVWQSFDRRLGYTGSPDRQSGSNMIFEHVASAYDVRDDEAIGEVILDNDVRALFYEGLAATMTAILRSGDSGPRVRYVGGCLRSPMKLARARRSADWLGGQLPSSAAESVLQEYWRTHFTSPTVPIRLPFWMGAVLERARRASADLQPGPADVARAIGDLRKAAAPLRRRRAEIEDQLRRGSVATESKLTAALQTDTDALTEHVGSLTSTAADVGTAAARVVVPAPAADILGAVAKAGTALSMPWIQRLALRIFDPHLLFIATASAEALEVRRAVEEAFDVFGFRAGRAGRSLAFMEAVNETTWLA